MLRFTFILYDGWENIHGCPPMCGTLWSGGIVLRFQRITCPDDGDSNALWSLGGFLPHCTASYAGRRIFMLDFRLRRRSAWETDLSTVTNTKQSGSYLRALHGLGRLGRHVPDPSMVPLRSVEVLHCKSWVRCRNRSSFIALFVSVQNSRRLC